jgi:SAM-dependent methyltransferase
VLRNGSANTVASSEKKCGFTAVILQPCRRKDIPRQILSHPQITHSDSMKAQKSIRIHSPTVADNDGEGISTLKAGYGHRSPYEAPLIAAAAQAMMEAGNDSKVILEVCCGHGTLLAGLAKTFPDARVVGMDQYAGTVEVAAKEIEGIPNAEVLAADVFHLDDWENDSVDLIIGQATLHHLTHNLGDALGEFARVLRPGGKCMFTFEPLSHNQVVNTVRSYRNAKSLLVDESNLYIETIIYHSNLFSSVEVQCFNLTASFLLKALPPNPLLLSLGRGMRKLDAWRFSRSDKALRKAANMNVIFTK